MTEFLEIYDDNLSPYFCRHVIKKFEKDNRQQNGETGKGYDPTIKDSSDLAISYLDDWKQEDETFFSKLSPITNSYCDRHFYTYDKSAKNISIWDTGYQIQRTTPDQSGYIFHNDGAAEDSYRRIITYLWYLNDIPEEDEGTTEFYDGTKVQPKEGRLILFPANWCYYHKGNPPKTINKYICTGWIWSN